MAYRDNYRSYLEEVRKDISYCKTSGHRIVIGYTSDLDIVFQYDSAAVNRLLGENLTELPQILPVDTIDSILDLARVLAAHMAQGIGAEIDITEYAVCEYLNTHFKGDARLGGTGAQGAAALAAMGMPLLVHISDRCREVCSCMDYPGLDTIQDGSLVPIMETAEDVAPVYHMVFQFSKGDTFQIGSKTYTVPSSNRLIMDYDTIHKDLHVNRDFQEYLEQNAESMVSYSISGLNAIVDPVLVRERLSSLDQHYRTVRKKNPSCIFYFESAHYLSPQVKHEVYQFLAQYVDIFGMDEEELVEHAKECGEKIDCTVFSDIIRGLDLIQKRYGIKGIILHTKDYSLYYGSRLAGIDIEKGLTLGNLMAGVRADTDRYGSIQDCETFLQRYPLSEVGLRLWDEFSRITLPQYLCMVPSRYIDRPKCTIGLGDTFAAGVQMAFVRQQKDYLYL